MKKFLTLLAVMILMSSPAFADDDDEEYFEEVDELEQIDIEIEQLEEEKLSYEEAAAKAAATAELIQGKIDSVSEFKRQLDLDAAEATADYEEKQAALDETLYRISENERRSLTRNTSSWKIAFATFISTGKFRISTCCLVRRTSETF